MSADVYLGPYARCKVEYVDGQAKGCLTKTCPYYKQHAGNNDFCGKCGNAISTFVVSNNNEKVDAFYLLGDEQPLSNFMLPANTNEHRAFIPNAHRSPPRKFNFEPEQDEWEERLTEGSVGLETSWFKDAFAPELEKLRTAYGPGNVEICWGFFSYTT